MQAKQLMFNIEYLTLVFIKRVGGKEIKCEACQA